MRTSTPSPPATTEVDAAALADEFRRSVQSVVAVHDDVLDPILVALFARGHVLIEGVPGIGKTLLARTISRCVACDFNRVQFTNDLMPADVVGGNVWRTRAEQFEFVPGPLFSNIVLADEINRTSPRTLSCLLEAMETGHASVDGETRLLGDPFLVLATRNPIEFHGTYAMPEAALDRFLVRVELDYPDRDRELELYRGIDPETRLQELQPIVDRARLLALLDGVRAVTVSEAVANYCYTVVAATRSHPQLALGASPRAALAWLSAARAKAALSGRDYVLPDDLKALAIPTLGHRIVCHDGGSTAVVLEEILASQAITI